MVHPSEIKKKKQRLEEIKAQLKKEFFGIDSTIDKIVSSIESWYIMPQALNSPIIINLWGLTGVGKTHLVRRLVQLLEYSTKFVEVQMDGYSASYEKDSICSILQSSSINEGEAGILLLDEFQRYRTVDEKGHGMEIKRFQDVWMLLSDGKFSTDFSLYTEIERSFMDSQYYKEHDDDNDVVPTSSDDDDDDIFDDDDDDSPPVPQKGAKAAKPPKARKKPIYELNYYSAQNYKRLLRLTEPVSEIMKWKVTKIEEMCKQAIDKRENPEIDYTKLLIFICGNLDEAFKIADDLENCDTDADIFYKLSCKISVTDIKGSLKERFKPEQISRLGNNHIIYPSLNKDAYQKIIFNATQKYLNFVSTLGITLNLENNVYKEIYENSVYPTQGARPVFSSIHKIFSSVIPTVALWAAENDSKVLYIDIEGAKGRVVASFGDKNTGEQLYIPIDLDIREIKKRNSLDFNTMVAVHEASHAIVHAILSGKAPVETNINLASYKGGYMMRDENFETRKDYLHRICCCLAGTIGEQHFFGNDNRSSGCGSDCANATELAADYNRSLMFSNSLAYHVPETRGESSGYTDFTESNHRIEDLMQECWANTKSLIAKNEEFILDVVTALLEKNTIHGAEFIKIASKYKLSLSLEETDTTTRYSELLAAKRKEITWSAIDRELKVNPPKPPKPVKPKGFFNTLIDDIRAILSSK